MKLSLSRMSRRWRNAFMALAAALLVAAIIAVLLSPASRAGDIDELVVLSGSYQDQQFVIGESVEVRADVTDDIFAAARDVLFAGASAHNVIAAGQSLTIRASTAQDMLLAGAEIDFAGEVTDDLIAAVCPVCPFGGRLHLWPEANIADDARLAGRHLDIDARIGGDLYAAAKRVILSGEIGGDARILAKRIVLAPGARIAGDLLYAGTSKPEIAEGAFVVGTIGELDMDLPEFEGISERSIFAGGIVAGLAFFLGLILLAAVFQFVVPNLLARAATTAREQTWSTLGRGVVVLLLTPVVGILLMVSIVGIPIALVGLAAFFVLIALAKVSIAYCIGLYLRHLFGRKEAVAGWRSRTLWTALGITLLVIIVLVPFVGPVIGLLALIAGLGALVATCWPISAPQQAQAL